MQKKEFDYTKIDLAASSTNFFEMFFKFCVVKGSKNLQIKEK
jgi:hypothetical protein